MSLAHLDAVLTASTVGTDAWGLTVAASAPQEHTTAAKTHTAASALFWEAHRATELALGPYVAQPYAESARRHADMASAHTRHVRTMMDPNAHKYGVIR